MSTISNITQSEQQVIINASGQNQQPASNISVFNAKGARECSAQQYIAAEYQDPEHQMSYGEWEVISCAKDFNISEEEIYRFLEEAVGYTKEKIKTLTLEKATEMAGMIDGVFQRIFSADNKEECMTKMIADTKKMVANGSDFKEIGCYLDTYRDNDLLTILRQTLLRNKFRYFDADNKLIEEENNLDENLKNKLKNAKSITDLSQDDLNKLMIAFLTIQNKENKGDINNTLRLFLNILDINLDNKDTKNMTEEEKNKYEQELGKTYSMLYNAFSNYKDMEATMVSCVDWIAGTCLSLVAQNNKQELFSGIIDRCKGKVGALYTFLDNDKINDMLTKLNFSPEELREMLTELQLSLPDENGKPNQVLVQKLLAYVAPLQAEINRILKIPEEMRTEEDKQALESFKEIQKNLEVFNIHILTFGDEDARTQTIGQLNEMEENGIQIIDNVFRGVYEYSLTIDSVDAVALRESLDRISGNAYSEILQEMGYELPTAENIDTLKEMAKNGTLNPTDGNDSTGGGFGYAQASQNTVSIAAEKAGILASYITQTPAQQGTFTVEGKAEEPKENNDKQNTESVNVTNLGVYNGNELERLINKKRIKFTDAVKQYSLKLSQSGKDFVVNKIKRKGKGEQSYALNKADNNAKFDIMKNAGLFGKGLNVKMDSIHTELAEEYMA